MFHPSLFNQPTDYFRKIRLLLKKMAGFFYYVPVGKSQVMEDPF